MACTLSNVGQFFVFTRTFTIGFRGLFLKKKNGRLFNSKLPFFDRPRIFDKVENSFDFFGF